MVRFCKYQILLPNKLSFKMLTKSSRRPQTLKCNKVNKNNFKSRCFYLHILVFIYNFTYPKQHVMMILLLLKIVSAFYFFRVRSKFDSAAVVKLKEKYGCDWKGLSWKECIFRSRSRRRNRCLWSWFLKRWTQDGLREVLEETNSDRHSRMLLWRWHPEEWQKRYFNSFSQFSPQLLVCDESLFMKFYDGLFIYFYIRWLMKYLIE